jgi:hypothetical protein
MTYGSTRDDEQLRLLDVQIDQFISRYLSMPAPATPRRTVILLVGGMGARLVRATMPYVDTAPGPQTFHYETVWLEVWNLLKFVPNNALKLAMHPGPDDEIRDLDDRIVVADGIVQFLHLSPYSRFIDWCEDHGLDLFVYAWDWRQPLEEVADFFLTRFLPRLRDKVKATCNADPLADYALIGHSAGGMVLGLVLRRADTILDGMTRAISVATPFYGYDGQIHRWFECDRFLEDLGDLNVIRTVSSFPGCYALPYMDVATFNNKKADFMKDTAFPLANYPSLQPMSPFKPVDPFHPQSNQYPSAAATGFSDTYLHAGLKTAQALAAGPAAAHAGKFVNIRGVAAANGTVGGITWNTQAVYVPGGNVTPIANDLPGQPGDGTQPAWSTRLLSLPKAQWLTVEGVEHMFMMEYGAIQDQIGKLLGLPMAVSLQQQARRAAARERPLVDPVSTEEALAFLRELRERASKPEDIDEQVTAFLRRIPEDKLQGIARRILMDIMKSSPANDRVRTPPRESEREKQAPEAPAVPKQRGPAKRGHGTGDPDR